MYRFEFGKNWKSFLKTLNPARIEAAEESLKDMLEVTDLYGKSFLDIGCGSGLFSLAAKRLGASEIRSFDYDELAVECASVLKQRYFPGHDTWIVERGDALNLAYLEKLGQFDVVYSYGVLHHTGDMWRALEYVSGNVKVGGKLFVAVYNDQHLLSKTWFHIKRFYNRLPRWAKPLLVAIFVPGAEAPYIARNLRQGKLPWAHWSEYYQRRGMSRMHDITDWVGGFPFEVARPDKIVDLYRSKGFKLDRLITCGGGHDNNQLVFTKVS